MGRGDTEKRTREDGQTDRRRETNPEQVTPRQGPKTQRNQERGRDRNSETKTQRERDTDRSSGWGRKTKMVGWEEWR